MKLFLILTSGYLLFGSSSTYLDKKEKCFYFCVSGPSISDSTSAVLYTDIKMVENDSLTIRNVAAKWQAVADRLCESTSGCFSDLNYYLTKGDAEKNLGKFMQLYKKHKLQKVNF
ncbi:MAG TPA: hypothetical protein VF144_21575 [Chitinophagaceae bacterium]